MSNHAIVIKARGEAKIESVSRPKLRDDYINIKVHAMGPNSTDWKHIDLLYASSPGAIVGCDYAGVVEEVGSKVTKDFKKGDAVTGFANGANARHHEDGTFADYITAKGDLQIKKPVNLSFEEAATLGVSISIVGQGLYQCLDLPNPTNPSEDAYPILIYGGSNPTGSLAIQYAKLSGLTVVTTASPHDHEYVKSLGADAVFDHSSPSSSEDIKAYTKDNLKHVFDCIVEDDSTNISVRSMSSAGGVYSSFRPMDPTIIAKINDKVQFKTKLVYSIVGEAFQVGMKEIPASSEDFEFAKGFWEMSKTLLEQGKIKIYKFSVNEGGKGLEGVMKGLDMMRSGTVTGRKLIYTL